MSRNRLHKSKLGAFREWLIEQGWVVAETKGEYEVLRMHWEGRPLAKGQSYWLIVHRQLEAPEHYTMHGQSEHWFSKWMRTKRQTDSQFVGTGGAW